MSLSTRPKRLWRTHPEPPDSYFARMATYPPIAARVLYNRGIRGPEEAKDFLDAALPAGESGSLLHEFRPAVERLARAVERGERVAVYGDFDADGVTSSAILTKGLRGLGVTVMPYIPDRVAEGSRPQRGRGPAARGVGCGPDRHRRLRDHRRGRGGARRRAGRRYDRDRPSLAAGAPSRRRGGGEP